MMGQACQVVAERCTQRLQGAPVQLQPALSRKRIQHRLRHQFVAELQRRTGLTQYASWQLPAASRQPPAAKH